MAYFAVQGSATTHPSLPKVPFCGSSPIFWQESYFFLTKYLVFCQILNLILYYCECWKQKGKDEIHSLFLANVIAFKGDSHSNKSEISFVH